jgi:hypothetical protein
MAGIAVDIRRVSSFQVGLFHGCIGAGLRVVKPMTYMSVGEYRAPEGCWLPSVLY